MPLDSTPWPVNETARALQTAADIIRTNGWWRGGTGLGPRGQVCIMQALWSACEEDDEQWQPAKQSLFASLNIEWRGPFSLGAAEWNDAPERTAEEVMSALEQAAAREMEKAG